MHAVRVRKEELVQRVAENRDRHRDEFEKGLDLYMLEMSVESEIELTAQEFAQYVRDDWGWKRQFTDSLHRNTRYLERRGR
jgi:hypothetical protein